MQFNLKIKCYVKHYWVLWWWHMSIQRYIVNTKKQFAQWKSESSQDCQKHDRADLIWRPCSLFSSTVEIWCYMCLFLWIKNCIWPLNDVCKKQCERNDRNSSRNTVVCLPTITLLHIHHSVQKFLTNLMSGDSTSTLQPRSLPTIFLSLELKVRF